MTVPATIVAPRQWPSPDPRLALRAEQGDTLVIKGAGRSGPLRVGIIIAVEGHDGRPPYLVRWTTGDYESRISPGPGARIDKHRA